MDEPEYLTADEAADKLRISKVTLWRLRKSGKLRWLKVSGSVRIHREDLESFRRDSRVKVAA